VLQIRQQQAAVLEYTSDMQALQRAMFDQRRSIAQLQQQLQAIPGQRLGVQAITAATVQPWGRSRYKPRPTARWPSWPPVDGTVATLMAKPGQAIQSERSRC
jgi:membrane fusion protein